MDSDLAARNANLARIFDDLGFDQLALIEGWNSVNTDFSSFSGHRLLADTYSTLPRHEIARVSELLQSQLRQPLLLNPVQTQLIEPNLTILKGTAPFQSSFNEYTSMFVRNGPRVQLGGIAGNNGTFGEEIILSGVHNRFSGSINQYRFKTDGVRNNGDQDQRIATLFVQHAATPQFNWQLESRYTSVDRGDLFLRFDPQNFLEDLREREEDSSIRLAARYQISPDSNVIANVKYSEATVDLDIGGADDSDVEADGAQIEFQNLIRAESAQYISGFGYFKRDRLDVDAEEDGSLTSTEFNTEHTNLYHYSLIEFPQNLTWTLGASAESFQEGDSSEKQLNPKLGIMWRPVTGTTVRAAGFTTFNRALLSQQTLEPTSVAGFNQFFDDGEGTDANRYGIAIDQVFSSSVYGGVELSKRSLKTPGLIFDGGGPSIAINASDEELLSAYLYWTPNRSIAFSATYQNERLDRDSNFIGPEEVSSLDTDRLTLGLSYFHSTNFRFKFSPSYVNQSGSFAAADFLGDTFSDGDNFWVVDMEFGYRLTMYNGYINLVAKNVLDQEFRFQDTDPEHPNILPGRFLFGALSLTF